MSSDEGAAMGASSRAVMTARQWELVSELRRWRCNWESGSNKRRSMIGSVAAVTSKGGGDFNFVFCGSYD